MITLDSKNPPLGMWFIALEEKLDFMGCLQPKLDVNQNPVAGHYIFDFRFRYHKDDLVFNSQDEKHWYHVETKESLGTPDEAIHKIRDLIVKLADMKPRDGAKPPDVDELLYHNYPDFHAFMEAFEARPYVYAKMASKEYAAELLRGAK